MIRKKLDIIQKFLGNIFSFWYFIDVTQFINLLLTVFSAKLKIWQRHQVHIFSKSIFELSRNRTYIKNLEGLCPIR